MFATRVGSGSSFTVPFALPVGVTARQAGASVEFVAKGAPIGRYGDGVSFDAADGADDIGSQASVTTTLSAQAPGRQRSGSRSARAGWQVLLRCSR